MYTNLFVWLFRKTPSRSDYDTLLPSYFIKYALRKKYTPWNKGKHIGLIPWNKNKTHSETTRQKMRENNARYWLGKKFSAKHRKNMSLAQKGRPSPLKGRKRLFTSKEHRRNISIAIKRWHQRRKKHGSKT